MRKKVVTSFFSLNVELVSNAVVMLVNECRSLPVLEVGALTVSVMRLIKER